VNNEPLLDKTTMLKAFNLRASRLRQRQVVVDVYLFGGGPIVFALEERETTQDLDDRFTSTSAAVSEVRAVAQDLSLPTWWLNEQGTAYLPRGDDAYPVPVFDHPNLRVMPASDRHLLAMKAAASRRNTRDLQDLRLLAERLDLTTTDEIAAIHDEVFPDNPLDPAKLAVISEAIGAPGRPVVSQPAVCRICGRTPRSPKSIAAGVGPICATRGLSR
jgi:hypothetical protein